MSQNDFNLANQGFPSMRSDMNSAFQALASNSSGTSAPSTTYAYQWWYDETNDILKIRNADDDAWIDFATFDQANDTWQLSFTEITTNIDFSGDPVFTGNPDYSGVANPATIIGDLGVTALTFKNLIINGSGRVNQRGYVSATATSGANEYTLDRWRVVTSGQSLTFTGDESGRTMTAPAGGVEQVIEGLNITETGTYVISFTGTATCTVDGVTKASGDTFTLTKGTNATVKFTSGTYTDVQVEAGDIVTPFEMRSIGQELALCQRYFEIARGGGVAYASSGTAVQRFFLDYKEKRAVPSIALTKIAGNANATSPVISIGPYVNGALVGFSSTNLSQDIVVSATVDAEI